MVLINYFRHCNFYGFENYDISRLQIFSEAKINLDIQLIYNIEKISCYWKYNICEILIILLCIKLFV